ncbi:MAG: hypothetical protein ACR2OZ_01130 [Verrucomicrobiales bacterium]
MNETTQPVAAFGKKVKKKDSGASGIMTLGIIGIAACVGAIVSVLMFLSAA